MGLGWLEQALLTESGLTWALKDRLNLIRSAAGPQCHVQVCDLLKFPSVWMSRMSLPLSDDGICWGYT